MPLNDALLAQVATLARDRGLLTERDFEALAQEVTRSGAAHAVPGPARYEIEAEIGQGAAAVVYRARDRQLNRIVALKILRDTLAMSESLCHRFEREARIMASLSHPNVVSVYDAGQADGCLYLVMELVDGRPLNRILGQRNFQLRSVVGLLAKAAAGVGAAHEKGIVHRDLKPSNILVAGNEPKVTDFGLARAESSHSELTRTGTAIGTPSYMSPEQIHGGELVTPRADVYALGAILYEMLTGRPPHTAETVAELYSRILIDEPLAPRKINPRAPTELETICLKALDKNPARRYPNGRAFADDLTRYLSGEPIQARPASLPMRAWRWMHRHRATSAVSAAGLAGLLAVAGVIAGSAAARTRERQRELQAWITQGHAARHDYRRLQAELRALKEQEQSLIASIKPQDDEEKKLPLWRLQQRIDALDEAMALRYTDVFASFSAALGVDPGNREARSALADLYFREYLEAANLNDLRTMKVKERLVRLLDEATYGPSLAPEGWVELDSNPTGALVELLDYEEALDRRLVGRPVRSLGACPLPRTKLPSGSYLLVLRKEGYRDVRYPLLIERGTEHAAKVNLYTEEEIGSDFIYVPAGSFIEGGDKELLNAEPRSQAAPLQDLFIAKYEVTLGEYVAFLNDVIAEKGAAAAQPHVPRRSRDSRFDWEIPPGAKSTRLRSDWDPDWPVAGIAWKDCTAYCEWMTRQARQRGEDVAYRMPTRSESEKAARGTDGRVYPWGNHFDWGFMKGGRSRGDLTHREPIGAFPKDESPYGVRDMAGSVMEWCEDEREKSGLKCIRGCSWTQAEASTARTTAHNPIEPDLVSVSIGFRVIRTLTARK